jgi:MFS family permease
MRVWRRLAALIGTRPVILTGLAAMAAGCAGLLFAGSGTPFAQLVGQQVLLGGGIGLPVPPMTSTLMGSIERSRSGVASGTLNAMRQVGSVVGVAHVLDMRPVQTVAARTVAQALLELAEAVPVGRAPDLAGPRQAELVALARAFVQHRGEAITVYPDADSVAGIPPRALLPENGARIQGPTFEEWLASDDAAALTI